MPNGTAVEWVVPDPEVDFQSIMAAAVVSAVNRTDSVGDKALATNLTNTVAKVRGVIARAGLTPLSLTAGSVPPEGKAHTLVLAMYMTLASQPSLSVYAGGEEGNSPFKAMVQDAKDWLKDLAKNATDYPTDPDTEFASAINWGDQCGDAAEHEAGVQTLDDGSEVPVENQDMTTHT